MQTAINEIKSEIISSGGVGGGYAGDILKLGLKYFLRKDTDDRSKGKISTDKAFEVGKFVQGASGAIIQLDAKNGQTIAELDKLYVRMKAYFETLEIINVNSIGGKMILSPAGSVTCLGVEELDDAYRCYFLGEQDGEIIENRWKVGMQAYSQMFNAKEGVSNKVANTYYWRLVTEVSRNTVEYNNQKCHYIDLSKTDCDSGSDIPKAGDVINHRGCRNDVDYKNFIDCIRSRRDPVVPVEVGHSSCTVCNLGNVAYDLKRTVKWNPIVQKFVNDPEATKLLHYEYRKPYTLG